jgi:serine/threonine-protein kinase
LKENAFGKYRLVAELGQGGMADVILAIAQGPVGFNKLVVIKRLREHLEGDPEFVSMLVDEARLAARLNHPNIVHTNEVGEIDGQFFMAMEYLEGQPLTRVKRRARRTGVAAFNADMEFRILIDVLAALQYAHELTDYDGSHLGVVHRDVTPSNVFVTYEGHVKVLDFGIAKARGRTTETKTGVVKGKMTYMPPEQALGHEVDCRADLYSVGVMLWEAAAGRRMWAGMDDVVILGRLINSDVPGSPKAVNPDVPDALDMICRKALAADPEGRYASAADFQADLEDFLEERGSLPSARDIARVVTQLFQHDRRELSEVIEGQLRRLREAPNDVLEPVVLADQMPPSMASEALSRAPASMHTPDALELDLTLPYDPGRRGRAATMSRVGIGLAGLAVVVGVGWAASRPSEPAQGADPAAASAPPPPVETPRAIPTTPPPVPTSVRVTLRALPSSATFVIDQGKRVDNPFVGDLPRDGFDHQVKVSAPGYKSKTITVRFDKDVVLDVNLERAHRGGSRSDPEPLAKPQTKKPRPDLLPGNPWGD